MKEYSNEIIIERPMEDVASLFLAIDHYTEWQPDLMEYNTFEGVPGQSGAKSRLVYRQGKSDPVKMVETIFENRLPELFRVKYATAGIISYQKHSFQALSENETSYQIHTEMDIEGLMKVLNILTPHHFEKQTQKFMESFKNFAEKHRTSEIH